MVAPPRNAKPVWRLTVNPCSSVSVKWSSRASFTHRVSFFSASSHEIRAHSAAPGARYIGCSGRRRLTASCSVDAPLGQSVPPLIGLSGSPSMWTRTGTVFNALPPIVYAIIEQPTSQYGHTVRVSLAFSILSWRTSSAAAAASKPKAASPDAPAPPNELWRNWRRVRFSIGCPLLSSPLPSRCLPECYSWFYDRDQEVSPRDPRRRVLLRRRCLPLWSRCSSLSSSARSPSSAWCGASSCVLVGCR